MQPFLSRFLPPAPPLSAALAGLFSATRCLSAQIRGTDGWVSGCSKCLCCSALQCSHVPAEEPRLSACCHLSRSIAMSSPCVHSVCCSPLPPNCSYKQTSISSLQCPNATRWIDLYSFVLQPLALRSVSLLLPAASILAFQNPAAW